MVNLKQFKDEINKCETDVEVLEVVDKLLRTIIFEKVVCTYNYKNGKA